MAHANGCEPSPGLISGRDTEAGTQRQVARGLARVPDLITESGSAPSVHGFRPEQHIRDETAMQRAQYLSLALLCLLRFHVQILARCAGERAPHKHWPVVSQVSVEGRLSTSQVEHGYQTSRGSGVHDPFFLLK